jgi:hypothetical protein
MVSEVLLTAPLPDIAPICHANQHGRRGSLDGLQSIRMLGKDPSTERGRSSGVEHDLAKVGVEGSNPFARSTC